MNRSKRYVFVPFCLLAQGVRAEGIVKKYAATVKPIMELLMRLDINVIQMPCPELFFDGFQRRPCGKPKYDNQENRKVCRGIANGVARQIEMLQANNCKVEAILGVDFSPSCAVKFLTGRPPQRRVNGAGIYTEELKAVLHEYKIQLPFFGIQIYQMESTVAELEQLLQKGNKPK